MRPDSTPQAGSLKSAGDQPRVSARRAQPGVLGGGSTNRRLTTGRCPHGPAPGSSEFPSFSALAVAGGPTLVTYALASLPSSDHLVSGGMRAHPGLPQGERARAAGMIAATVPPHPLPRRWGTPSCPHCMVRAAGLQQVQQQQQHCRVVFWLSARLGMHYTTWYGLHEFPIRTGQSISFPLVDSLHRAGYQVTPPHRRTDGARFIQPRLRAARKARAGWAGLAAMLRPRPGGTLCTGWRRSGFYAMRWCGAEQKGIEAIFRAACGRVYSRSWTQRILGRYADD